jgi:hypothetical protein
MSIFSCFREKVVDMHLSQPAQYVHNPRHESDLAVIAPLGVKTAVHLVSMQKSWTCTFPNPLSTFITHGTKVTWL